MKMETNIFVFLKQFQLCNCTLFPPIQEFFNHEIKLRYKRKDGGEIATSKIHSFHNISIGLIKLSKSILKATFIY